MSGWDDDETAPVTQPMSNEWGNDEPSDSFGIENRRGRGGRGRGTRGRGGNFGNRDNAENGERSNRGGFKGRDGYKREENDGERPARRNNNEGDNDENKDEEKPKRELYIPPEPTNDEGEIFKGISAGINFNKFNSIEVSVSGNNAKNLPPIASFKDSGLREFLLENVKKSGYLTPTPIQKYAIPVINQKRDLMGCAQTGSGKTAAFLLPILNTIMASNDTLQPGKPQALVVAPSK